MKDILYFNTLEDVKLIDMMRLSKSKEHDYSQDYLTFEALEDGTFALTVPAKVNSNYMTSVSYSIDNGETWTTTTVDNTAQTITTPTINAGDKVLWKGVGKQMAISTSSSRYSQFSSTSNFNVSGNIMSLLYDDEFAKQVTFPSSSTYNFCYLFKDNNKLISAENLILPATTLAYYCYTNMFYGCTSLTLAPELPATTLAEKCYNSMFKDCKALTTAPVLPATILANYCYQQMFYGCTLLTIPPATLPAITLVNGCYQQMFQGCTALTVTPTLPATKLASNCYQNMFTGCISLTTTPTLPATTLADSCYSNMFFGTNILPDHTNIDFTSGTVVNSGGLQGLFAGTKVTYSDLNNILPINNDNKPCLPVTTLSSNCYTNMFYGCTSLEKAPELPATTLASNCYQQMFYGCTNLTTAPSLPATTLAKGCYSQMFQGCTALTTTPILSATTLATSCCEYMFYGCTSLTTAPELPATVLVSKCYDCMFCSCTNLSYIKAMFTTTPSTAYTSNWVQNVAANGTFIKSTSASWTTTGVNGIPTGWTVETADS